MKKLLISLTILFSLFICINSVNAEKNTLTYDNSSPLEYLTMTNTINLSDAEVTTLMQSVGYSTDLIDKYLLRRNYALNNNKNDKFYFVNPGIANGFYADRIFVNMSYEDINQAWLEISEKLTYGYTDLYLNIQSKYTYDYTYYYFDYGTSVSSNSSAWLSSNSNFASIKYNSNTKVLDNNKISRNYFFETNMTGNISFKKGSFGNVSSIIIDDITYSLNDTLPITLEDGYHSLKETKPTIKLSSIDKQNDYEKININFSEFDREKYIYLYNFNNQPGLENWHEIIENDYVYKSILNGTLYIQLIDKQLFNETKEINTISSATYTFTNLLMYEDIIDISKITSNTEIEYRYYGSTPVKFYLSSYRYGDLPENVNCIVGTGIYECNINNIMDVQSIYSFYSYAKNEVTGEDVYVKKYGYNDSPDYNSQIYEFYSKEDFTKYPITCVDNTSDCWSNNYYRSFTIDLTTYINSSSQYKSNYIYVYYDANIYEKSWNSSLNINEKLEDFTEDNIKPPTYQESNSSFIQGFNDWFAPIIELINKRFPIIAQIGTILSSIFINNHEDITNLEIDLSFLGISHKYTLIDINAYKDVKDIVFFFEYCSILMIAIPKIVKNVKESFND